MVFFEAAACLRRRREAWLTAVAGVTAARRLEEGLFRVESLGAAAAAGVAGLGAAAAGVADLGEEAAAACLVVSRRRFHIGGEGSGRSSHRRRR